MPVLAPAPDLPVPPTPGGLLLPGRNCWRMERAGRIGVVIDAADYFRLAKEAMRRARHSIYLTAWDMDGRIRLRPQDRHPGRPDQLDRFLTWLAARRPGLHIHVLKWDYAELFDVMRQSRPMWLRNLLTSRRLQYRLDGDHPPDACHHQKILVIDDAVAFCGGIDLTANRWDTRAHRAHDPHRRQPDGKPYEPFHDLMMAVDGDAARALGELARERWRRATGVVLAPPPASRSIQARRDPWPPGLVPLLRDHPVAIARTEPEWNGRPAVSEVKTLHLDAIAAARRSIYMESQYFASAAVADALKARLEEPDGPEVVVVNPVRTPSWLETEVMTAARHRLVETLRAADRHGRFRILAAVTDGGACITVHAKTMIVDDRLLRIGSANLSNRSMGLDTECDAAIEAGEHQPEARAAIARVRNDLLAEHLGSSVEEVAATLEAADGSLIRAIERLDRPEGRRLLPLRDTEPSTLGVTMMDVGLFDPERTVGRDDAAAGMPSQIPRRRGVQALVATLVALAGMIALWRYGGLGEWAAVEPVADALRHLRSDPLGPLVLIVLYVLGGLVMFPLLVLVGVTAVLFGPVTGFLTAMTGALASASVLFWIGRGIGRGPAERLGGRSVRRISHGIARRGVFAVAMARAVPVAPFSVVNLAAGASRIRFGDYLAGTAVGLAPGTLAFSLIGHQLERALVDPTATDVALLVALAAAAIALGWGAGWLMGRFRHGRADTTTTEGPEEP